MRRCRDCGHRRSHRLPELRKKIIYLDQFVISNLMKLDNPATKGHAAVSADAFWPELRDLLFQLGHLQAICCPDSHSHEEESRTSPFNADLKKTYERLSAGITFAQFDSIKSNQIGELAYAWAEGRPPAFDFDPRRVLSGDPNGWSERYYIVTADNPFISDERLRQVRAAAHANIGRLFLEIWTKEKQTFEYWYEFERTGFQGYLLTAIAKHGQERAEAVRSFRSGEEPSLDVLDKILPSFAEQIAKGIEEIMLSSKNGVVRAPETQGELVKSFFQQNRIADAPFVKLQSLMVAAMAMRAAQGQKDPPNRGTVTDIDTVAHLLPYCDAMFMDNGCRSLLLDVPSALRPADAGKMFSLNVKKEFLGYLRSIRDGISSEQAQAIRDVYGDGYVQGLPGAGQG